jgi:hypothetical protein
MKRRQLWWILALVAAVLATILVVPEPYTLPAALSIFGAFFVTELVRTWRGVREELAETAGTAPTSSVPPRRVERLGLALVAVWLVPVMAALVTMNFLLLGFDHTSAGFWIAVAVVVAAFEVLVWAFAFRGFRRDRRSA